MRGNFEEAVRICRVGLAHHPGFVSARVTLGQSLLALEQVEDAAAQFRAALRVAPDHVAALRAVADIHRRRGEVAEAVHHYRAALALVPRDKELSDCLAALQLEAPDRPNTSAPGLPAAVESPEPPPDIAAGAATSAGADVATGAGRQAIARLNAFLAVIHADRARRARADAAR